MKQTQLQNEENIIHSCGMKTSSTEKQKMLSSPHVLCVLNTSTLPWTRQSSVSPEPPNNSELRSPDRPLESSYNEPEWGAAGLSQDQRLLSATRSPLIRRHAPRDYEWKKNITDEMYSWVLITNNNGMRFLQYSENQGRDRGYWPKSMDEADNPYQDLDCAEYHKTESNNCSIIHWTKKNGYNSRWKWEFSSKRVKICKSASSTKRANLTWLALETVPRNHTWHDYRDLKCPWHDSWLLYNVQALIFEKSLIRFRPIRKEIVIWIYNKDCNCL